MIKSSSDLEHTGATVGLSNRVFGTAGQASSGTRRLRKRPRGRYRYVRLRWRVLFAVIDFAGHWVFRPARLIRRGLFRRHAAPQGDPRTILLVQLDHLGDAIITTAILPALRERYPDASIEVLAGPAGREVFEAMTEVDRVYVSRANRFARGRMARFAWIAATLWWGIRLRRRRADLAIDVRGDFPIAVILWLCGARRRLGWDCGGGGFLLTDSPRYIADRPEVESRWALMAQLGLRRPEDVRRRWPRWRDSSVAVGQAFSLSGRGEMSKRNGTPGQAESLSYGTPKVIFHLGAGTPAKQWPVAHWRELLGRLIVDRAAEIVLIGGGGDRQLAAELLNGRVWPGVTDCTGRLNIVELAAVLRGADVLVGADSGPAHLAAAVDTPVVVLFSGTNSARQWKPCGESVVVVRHRVDCSPCHCRRCPRTGHPCMNRLPPEQVALEVVRVLDSRCSLREPAFCSRSEPAFCSRSEQRLWD